MTARFRSERLRVQAARLVVIAVFLALWQVAPTVGWVDSMTIVPLDQAVGEAVALITSGEIVHGIVVTVQTIVISFAIAVVCGLLIGYLLWRHPLPFKLLNPYLTTYYALPVFVFYPALIAIFGLTVLPVILLATMWAVVAVILGTVTGLEGVPQVYHKTVRVYGLSHSQALRRVYFGAASPLIFNGLKLAISYCIIGVIAAEFVLAPGEGLGYEVSFFYNNFALEKMYATVLIIVVVASALTAIVGRGEVLVRGRR